MYGDLVATSLCCSLSKVMFLKWLLFIGVSWILWKKKIWLKGGYPMIFASNVFPNSHLIQKCIQNQQQLLILYTFLIQMRVGKIFDTKMIGWTHFIIMQKIALSLQRPSARFKNWVTKPSNNSIFIRPRKPLELLNIL